MGQKPRIPVYLLTASSLLLATALEFSGVPALTCVAITGLLIVDSSRWIGWALLLVGGLALGGMQQALLGLGVGAALAGVVQQQQALRRPLAAVWMVGIIALLVFHKTSAAWIGFSYLALRLLSLLIDFQQARLPVLAWQELITYALFPPSLIAGPIDRAERFAADLRAGNAPTSTRLLHGCWRVALGAFKKFVLADSLALIALSPALAADIHTPWAAWLAAYAYALRLYFDFGGYSDMAIGGGILLGLDLPENFNRPYLQPNLAQFWRNWHMTLTDWFRTYVFLPFSRVLLRHHIPVPRYLVAQVVTMTLIAWWHGLTVNFMIWGLWHALGLYAQRVWGRRSLPMWLGVLLTFHFVVIGWVFFALPTPALSVDYLARMFGL